MTEAERGADVTAFILPPKIEYIHNRLGAAGFKAYAVGGCVRDLLRGENPSDWDIACSATPGQTAAVFRSFRTLLTGAAHGTVTIIMDGEPVQITTFRRDGSYSDGRHPDSVEFAGDIETDLARRDFTINAIALGDEGLIDPFGGMYDLQAGLIRCVGNPADRFAEDALRIMRALRFASVLGFGIERETTKALDESRLLLRRLAHERLLRELLLFLSGKSVASVFRRFYETVCVCFSRLEYEADEAAQISAVLENRGSAEAALALLLKKLPPDDAGQELRYIRVSNATAHRVLAVHALLRARPDVSRAGLRRLLSTYNAADVRDYLAITGLSEAEAELDGIVGRGDLCGISELDISGHDLVALGLRGKAVGAALNALVEAVISGSCKNRHGELLSWLNRNFITESQN